MISTIILSHDAFEKRDASDQIFRGESVDLVLIKSIWMWLNWVQLDHWATNYIYTTILMFVMGTIFFKEVSYAHPGCIYLSKKTIVNYYYN